MTLQITRQKFVGLVKTKSDKYEIWVWENGTGRNLMRGQLSLEMARAFAKRYAQKNMIPFADPAN